MTADIERMAREAGFLVEHDGCILIRGRDGSWLLNGALARFAALVRAHALEDAAKVCETQDTYGDHVGCWFDTLAAAIRALATQAQRKTP